MSSLFSIGEDELDLDDEDCILAACGIGSSINRITNNYKNNSDSELNQSSSTAQLLRTKEVEKLKSSNQRWPFESISNVKTCNKAHDKKRTSTEQLHKSSSFINWQKNSTTSQSVTNGLNVPATKRFAIDKTCNSPSKRYNSANGGNLLRSSSMPAFTNADGKEMAYSSLKTYPCNNSPPVQRNSVTRDSQIRELPQCSFTHFSTPSASKSDPTGSSCKTLNHSKPAALLANSPVWQQKQALAGSPVINIQTGHFPTLTSNTTTVSCDKTKRQSTSNFKKNKIETRDLETTTVSSHRANTGSRAPQTYQAVIPSVNRQSGGTGPRTPQKYQAVTSNVNRQSGGAGPRTPQTYQAVTPSVNRHSDPAGSNTPQKYQAVTPGVNRQSGGTGPRTPQKYQAVTSNVNRQSGGAGPRTPQTYQAVTPSVNRHSDPAGSNTPQKYQAVTPGVNRQSGGAGPRTPQGYQAVTPGVNRHSDPAGSKTPHKYQAVTPGVNRQSGGAGPRTPQGYQAVAPGVNRHSDPAGSKTPQKYQAVTPSVNRQSGSAGSRTPQGSQTVTPDVNRNLARTPSSSRTPKTRKFPGPAGLLPKLSPGQNLDDASFVSPLPTTRKPSPVQSKVSQASTSEDDDFNRDPWTYMYQDFVKNVPLAMRYTIIRVYTEAIQQTLDHGKVPCLCALVKAFSLTEADASVLLKDPTGEIHGTLHRKVLENYQTELAPGAGLILKHVSVFSPAPRKHYLNITPGNILQIYPPDPQNITSSQPLASQCTQVERQQEKQSYYMEPIVDEVDCNKQQSISAEGSTEEEPWNQKDCFEDLLEGLDDDEDLLDEALLV